MTSALRTRGPDLLPLEDGQQYRFKFTMSACVGCHSCEVACAEQNATPVESPWRRVGELEGGSFPATRRFSISMACNHCLEPTCLSGCPTNAYVKLPNGIVQHHPDECVGCQYCIWNCPYEVPAFDRDRRIVAKCDLCKPRLEQGQTPACAAACPTRAIAVEPFDVEAWRADFAEADAPGLPPASITLSTTRIVAPPVLPEGTAPANVHPVEPEDPHWPLIALTLLTQLSLGTVASAVVLGAAGADPGGVAVAASVAGSVALLASLLHLGKPGRALKALRNLRTSWLSREVAAFSLFAVLAFAYVAWPGLAVGLAATAVGAIGVYASARLYLVPARPVWNSRRTPIAFFATAVAAGPVLALLCVDRAQVPRAVIDGLLAVAALGSVVQVLVHAHLLRAANRGGDAQHQGTAELLRFRFFDLLVGRVGAVGAAVALVLFSVLAPLPARSDGGRIAILLVIVGLGELAGRYLFYVTVVPYRMASGFFGARR